MSQGYAAPSHAAVEIEPDDIDDIVAIPGNQLDTSAKGKGRANDRLGVPTSAAGGNGSRSGTPSQQQQNGLASGTGAVSGKIGGNRSALRSNIGGIAVETRYSGVNSLDESVGESLVSCASRVLRCVQADFGGNHRKAARLASDRQQASASPLSKFWQCCTA